jgi:uncharacterized protein YggE
LTKSRTLNAARFGRLAEQGETTMVRTVFAYAISALIAGALVAPAEAQQPQSERQANIVVGGEGSISAAPDYAEITAGVTTKAKTAKEAADANSKLMAAVMAALLDVGIAKKDIQTSQFSVQPIYTTQGNTEPKLTGFSASNQVTVTVRQIDKVSEIVDRMVSAGATNIGNLAFLHSDMSKLLDQARESAVADARRKAELYARASGVTLGRVVWINEGSTYTPFAPKMALRQLAVATPIATGEDTLRVEITVGFDIAH